MLQNKQSKQPKGLKGQGVVEYGGALVIATLLVSAVMAAMPTLPTTFLNTLLTTIQSLITGFLG